MQNIITDLLTKLGEDTNREGLVDTPRRVEESFAYLTGGYKLDAAEVIKSAIFEECCDEMIIVRDIDIFSLCEHHMLPFYGKAHVAYIPDGKIIGLSKIPRVIEVFARRLQVQERLTHQVSEALFQTLQPKGVGVVVEALHLCMAMRGVEKQNSTTITSSMLGNFKKDHRTRQEFLSLIKG